MRKRPVLASSSGEEEACDLGEHGRLIISPLYVRNKALNFPQSSSSLLRQSLQQTLASPSPAAAMAAISAMASEQYRHMASHASSLAASTSSNVRGLLTTLSANANDLATNVSRSMRRRAKRKRKQALKGIAGSTENIEGSTDDLTASTEGGGEAGRSDSGGEDKEDSSSTTSKHEDFKEVGARLGYRTSGATGKAGPPERQRSMHRERGREGKAQTASGWTQSRAVAVARVALALVTMLVVPRWQEGKAAMVTVTAATETAAAAA